MFRDVYYWRSESKNTRCEFFIQSSLLETEVSNIQTEKRATFPYKHTEGSGICDSVAGSAGVYATAQNLALYSYFRST
jgi:hypothetical protein